MLKRILPLFLIITANQLFCQLNPVVTSWLVNPDSSTGYGGNLSNVQKVQYSSSNVYVSCTCIPGYDIGPWQGNPNTPSNQNFVFKITQTPTQNNGTLINTPLGHIGVWKNGVSIYNAKDGNSYSNQDVWHQNAIMVEGSSFDQCLGHPAQNGEYHLHLNPTCLYDDGDNTAHSPIVGYAFDGFPIYGANGFANTDGTGGIKRMESGYQLRSITSRTTLPGGATASSSGPLVSTTYPLGYYVEDYEFIQGSGDLDEHNGRTCVTPEYPNGTYAYFITIDSNQQAVYPYVLGPQYYGTVPSGNTGPGSGHNTVSETVTTYTATGIDELSGEISISTFPNPSTTVLNIFLMSPINANGALSITDIYGKNIKSLNNIMLNTNNIVDVSDLANGVYFIALQSANNSFVSKFIVQH